MIPRAGRANERNVAAQVVHLHDGALGTVPMNLSVMQDNLGIPNIIGNAQVTALLRKGAVSLSCG